MSRKQSYKAVARRVNKLTANPDHLRWFETQAKLGLKLMEAHYAEVRRWHANHAAEARKVLESGRLGDHANAGKDHFNFLVSCLVPAAVWKSYELNSGDAAARSALAKSLAAAMGDPKLDRRRMADESDEAMEARRREQEARIAEGGYRLVDDLFVLCHAGPRPRSRLLANGEELKKVSSGSRVAIAATRVLLLHDAEIEDPRTPGAEEPLAKIHARHLIKALPDTLLESDLHIVEHELKALSAGAGRSRRTGAGRRNEWDAGHVHKAMRASVSEIGKYVGLSEAAAAGGETAACVTSASPTSSEAGTSLPQNPVPVARLVLRGRGALVALRNSACALRDDAFTLIRVTPPESDERMTGTSSGHTPRSTGSDHAGLRGVNDMLRDHKHWISWKIGIIGLIKEEPMQRAVERYIDAVMKAGRKLIDTCYRANGTTHSPWADHFSDLNEAINDLEPAFMHIPADPAPIRPSALLDLVRRLIDQNGKIGHPNDDGSVDAHGYPAAMEEEVRGQTWEREMQQCGDHHAFWLDRTTVESTARTTWSQRVMATLFELEIAVRMLEKGTAADDVVAAHKCVLGRRCWDVLHTQQWEKQYHAEVTMPVRWPLMATRRPIGQDALDRLDQAVRKYAAIVVATTTESAAAASAPGSPSRRSPPLIGSRGQSAPLMPRRPSTLEAHMWSTNFVVLASPWAERGGSRSLSWTTSSSCTRPRSVSSSSGPMRNTRCPSRPHSRDLRRACRARARHSAHSACNLL